MTQQEHVVVVSRYIDVAEAAGDFEMVARKLVESGASAPFDAVILGRKASGDARIYKWSELLLSADDSESQPAAVGGLAAGLSVALIPDVVVGSGLGDAATAQLTIVAGYLTRSTGRPDLRELGEFVDEANAALAVVVPSDVANAVRGVLGGGDAVIERSTPIDLDVVHAALAGSRRAAG